MKYADLRDGFVKWLKLNEYDDEYARSIMRYLDKYVKEIKCPSDVMEICLRAKTRNIHFALRALLNYAMELGYDEEWIKRLKKAIPNIQSNIDIHRASEDEIIRSLVIMNKKNEAYAAVYNALLDSGLRLSEVPKMIEAIKEGKFEDCGDFIIVELGFFRNSKLAYIGIITKKTLEMIKKVKEINVINARGYLSKINVVKWKYLRKYAYDKMLEVEIPESVAEFIQGRFNLSIGAKRYAMLKRQARVHYPKYLKVVEVLRAKARTA